MGVAGFAATVAAGGSAAMTRTTTASVQSDADAAAPAHFILSDVTLEDGFVHDQGEIIGTRTGRYDLEIKDGRILSVTPTTAAGSSALPRLSANGRLALPALRDMHIHLDKTFYGGPWQAPRPRKGKTIMDMIALERSLLPELLPVSRERAEGLIDLLLEHGTTTARSHCNIDPVSGLKSLEHLNQALENYRGRFSCEIVAFPQHGLLLSEVEPLMRESMGMGVAFVGGLDPTNVDGRMEASLDAMFGIAVDYDKGVDIHLHESGASGAAAIRYMLDTVEKTPSLKGRLTLSHAFALANLPPADLDATAERMAASGVSVASTIPIGRSMMPLARLREKGVRLMSGTDSVIDMWSPFGSGDMLDKANLYAQLYSGSDEFGLSRALAIATGDVLPLNNAGERAWPKAGDAADLVLTDASCSAEAVARKSKRTAVFHGGRMVFGALT